MIKKLLTNVCLVGLCVAPHVSIGAEVGVRFVVDDGLITTWRSEQRIRDELDSWINETNTILADSQVDMTLYRAETVMTEMATHGSGNTISNESVIFDHMKREIHGFANLENRAKEIGADYTITIVPALDNGKTGDDKKNYCGIANQVSRNNDEIRAKYFMQSTAIVKYTCGTDTFAHELGHLFGLAHGTQVARALDNSSHNNGYHTYSKGWGRIVEIASTGDSSEDETQDAGEYGTVMVGNYMQYWSKRNANTFVEIFSNPQISDVICSTNSQPSPCGSQYQGDAARTIREFRNSFAAHQTPDVHTLDFYDDKLQTCISQTYPYTPGSDAYDINRINSISCAGADIGSIDGLENITGLTFPSMNGRFPPTVSYPYIDLSDNRVVNLSALYDVIPGASINLQGNNVASCHQLDELAQIHPGLIRPERCLNIAALISIFSLI
ncbi:zinc-dependent metalloprotease family protein [Pseudoalteromonas piscicida]|uniref:zinc-dependent metalloprotease family protein n=1 Tax=Pseudoalteromonas piscicida TaxID=43662 RepID=UPI0030AD6ADA